VSRTGVSAHPSSSNVDRLFRRSLLATGLLNLFGAVLIAPPSVALRALAGLPEAGHPLHAWLLSLWILFFGVGYLRLSVSTAQERYFVAIGAAGKASFALLLACYALAGDLPVRAALAGSADLAFAAIFACWLFATRAAPVL
jgi:hypothetical protein